MSQSKVNLFSIAKKSKFPPPTPPQVTAADFYLDFPDQEKLTLTADIKYKSNWQQGALKGMISSFCCLPLFSILRGVDHFHFLPQLDVVTNGYVL